MSGLLSWSLLRYLLKRISECRQVVYKRKHTRVSFTSNNRYGRVQTTTAENQYERLADSVTPLHRNPYDKQLKIKKYFMERVLQKAANILQNERRSECDPKLTALVAENGGSICSLDTVKASPVISGYRNKIDLGIGTSVSGEPNTVGLFIGKGSNVISVSPDHLISIREDHKEIRKVYQEFVRQSKLPLRPFGDGWRENNQWKYIRMRSTTEDKVMVTIQFYPWLDKPELTERAKCELTEYFHHGSGKLVDIHSLYFQACRTRHCSHEFAPYQLIKGEKHVYEQLLGKVFRISPDSFFQTNTKGAEVLYSTIQEFSQANKSTTVLDLCCGTGTIGIILADRAKDVLGIEIVQQAVLDAENNAKINGLHNCQFVPGKVHRKLKQLLDTKPPHVQDDVVAVLNPTRKGVNRKVVQSIRACPAIRRLVYVSCKPYGNVLKNFLDFIVPESEKLAGPAFNMVRTTAVDMFPYTLHCELVALFER